MGGIPIARIGEVASREVDIEGTVTRLWGLSNPTILQVGLIEGASGTIKFTAWRASDVAMVEEGQRVRLRSVARNWYRGRVSVALTGWSRVIFPGRE
ncbi:MAG: hypothetical protein R3324_02260 [Halobacteriales archaeon]|nr:hypothetical protein [Halobacteriales archaeon]